MTLILITGGAILYNLFESEKSLKDMDSVSRIIFSLFGSISARTAGFNITDISAWGYPTVFLMIFLMWIGASPGSTGGGIKTTTFALALRNTWNFIRGRDILIIGNREISGRTITRVLTIIVLSLSVISAGFLALLIVEPAKNPVSLLFECFSAFGTVGLSLADSSTFSDSGKVTDIILMFIGRVGPLTLLAGLFTTVQKGQLKYPDIDILIN
jgi:Trk-type K+ transport system membrane component